MRLLSGEAVLLDVVNLHDFDRIVTYLTAEWGQKRGVAKGARRKFSRFGGQLQLLSKVSIRWFEKENRDLVRIEAVELIRSPRPLLDDLEGILIGSYMAEHLVQFTQENEESGLFFRLLESTLEALRADAGRDLALRYFETWVLRLAGIFPLPRCCPFCGEDLSRTGGFLARHSEGILCPECAPGGGERLRVGVRALDFLRRTGRESLLKLQQVPPDEATMRRVEEICCRVRRDFLNHELRSYDVMKSTLGERLGA